MGHQRGGGGAEGWATLEKTGMFLGEVSSLPHAGFMDPRETFGLALVVLEVASWVPPGFAARSTKLGWKEFIQLFWPELTMGILSSHTSIPL